MKKVIYNILLFAVIMMISCDDDDDINVFDKTADERAAEAIAALKADLIAPPHGWKVSYKPVDGAGSYFVIMKFEANNKVTIETDLGANSGEFQTQTISYRIDSSLGLELIFETYSFFSFLFEQEQATFGAEYEFNYVNKTPDNALVFKSKTDIANPTIIVFQQAAQNEKSFLAKNMSLNLDKFGEPLNFFGSFSSVRIAYTDKDLAIYFSIDAFKRVAEFNYISLKSSTATGQALTLTTPYTLRRDSIVFDTPLRTTFNGNNIVLKSLYLNTLTETMASYCPPATQAAPVFSGVTSSNDKVSMETTLFNNNGASFKTSAEIYIADVQNIINENGQRAASQIVQDLKGALVMVIYNDYAISTTENLSAVGFLFQNDDETTSIAVKRYTATYAGNAVELVFDPDVFFVRNPDTDADVNNMQKYLDLLMQGGKAYIYKLDDQFYELYNPCSGWSFAFQRI
ncbi:DUF4302 domain-containing protein [Fulvivirgaceae bacterium PWU4]|uniref:DUF4302 domain-containing protein n=1 Tax=Chryseosolibacter histidini TaxID=2782349 RepID=A0AAP2GJB6_9BACT|nr:DUF4302 domain-containing protein [Chryseosolibacter histidini]MBT1697839.1 DUF4302 domain-containing protein [Chryseosolibacter histidini]